jgi:hypothetical protein
MSALPTNADAVYIRDEAPEVVLPRQLAPDGSMCAHFSMKDAIIASARWSPIETVTNSSSN